MEKVNIIGGSLLGLLCGINLLKENYEVNIYEKRNYIGGAFNSFEGMELTQAQMFHNIILSTEEKNMLENSFGIEFEKKKIYKVLNFVCGYKIDIKFGKDNLIKLFHRLAKTQNDKNIVTNLFADIDEIDRVENLLRNKSESLFFSFNKFIYEKRLNAIVNKYKKIRVENLIDSINSIYIKEVIKSTTNAKCSSIVFIEFLRIMSSSDIYSFKGGKKNLFSVLVKIIMKVFLSLTILQCDGNVLKGFNCSLSVLCMHTPKSSPDTKALTYLFLSSKNRPTTHSCSLSGKNGVVSRLNKHYTFL